MKSLKETIDESLIVSYDSEKLIKKLQKYFDIDEIYRHKSKSNIQRFSLKISSTEFDNKIYDEKFFKILDFYGYYVTEITKAINENKYIVSFEPIFGKKCNDLVYESCNGIIYHVTKTKFIQSIRKKGLIPLEGKTYRNFTERIFFSCGKNNEEITENINTIIKQITSNNIILKIDLKKYHYNVDFYFDPSEDDIHNFIYCNAYFPPHMIEEFDTLDEFEEDLKLNESRYIETKLGKLYIKNV